METHQTIASPRRSKRSLIPSVTVDPTGRRRLVLLQPQHDRNRREFHPEYPVCRWRGYGGQVLHIDGNVVLAYKKQDAGKTNTYYFTGPNCGGTGWIMFDVDVPRARWAETLATLGRSDDPQICGKNYSAWTRTRRDEIAFPFIEDGRMRFVTVDAIVSEHYDDRDPVAARLMERFYFGNNWGWLRWERWEKSGPVPSDLPQRCPDVTLSGYPSGASENWQMVDRRMWTNIRPQNGERTAQIGLALRGRGETA